MSWWALQRLAALSVSIIPLKAASITMAVVRRDVWWGWIMIASKSKGHNVVMMLSSRENSAMETVKPLVMMERRARATKESETLCYVVLNAWLNRLPFVRMVTAAVQRAVLL